MLCTTLSLINSLPLSPRVTSTRSPSVFRPHSSTHLPACSADLLAALITLQCNHWFAYLFPSPVNPAFPDQVISSSGIEYGISNSVPSLPRPPALPLSSISITGIIKLEISVSSFKPHSKPQPLICLNPFFLFHSQVTTWVL